MHHEPSPASAYGIRLLMVVTVGQEEVVHGDQWLSHYDPDAHDGRGYAESSTDPAKALRFPDPAAAWQFWRQTSTVRPTRPDGKPNRPLTAFTVSVDPLIDSP